MELGDRYPDLTPLVKGSSFSQLFQLFWTLAQVRYATRDQLRAVNFKLATKKKLASLTELGYLAVNSESAYFTTPKSLKLLENHGYNAQILQTKLTGKFTGHELKITAVLLSLMVEKYFYAVFYPTFTEPPAYDRDFLRPDACLVYRKPEAYKIQFLEVETPKPNWQDYLFAKKEKYEKIARDPNTYDKWWRVWSGKLGLPFPERSQFFFSILCVGEVSYEWKGWTFRIMGDGAEEI